MSINPGSRVACVLVGLPGTSKTLVAQKVCRYLQWLGIASKVFNVGNYRRKLFGAYQPHSFFDPSNTAGARSRAEASQEALKEMIHWFRKEQGVVAVYDATNATRAKREVLLQECRRNDVQVMFVESVCEDEGLRLANALENLKYSPDYEQMDSQLALDEFKTRVKHYEGEYETLTEKDLTYIKLIDAGSQVIVSQIQGYIQSRIVYYLMNLHIAPRNIYFSRHGESLFNVMGLLGGDSELSPRGKQYARALPSLVSTYIPNAGQLTIWTSTKKRTIATAKHLPHKKLAWEALDELEAGRADGLTYGQVEDLFPEDFANRDNDKFNYRYQEGESYRDVVARLEPVIMDLERQNHVLIIGHQAILRCIYAYFMNYSYERLPYIKIPLHTVIQLTPGAYACEEKRFKVDIEAVDTHRPKPKAGGSAANEPKEDMAMETEPTTPIPSEPETVAQDMKPTLNGGGAGLFAAATADTPRIILSNLTTTTFRDAIHPHADSVKSRAVPIPPTTANTTAANGTISAAVAVTTTTTATATATTTVVVTPTPTPTAKATATATATVQQPSPAAMELPPLEEKARLFLSESLPLSELHRYHHADAPLACPAYTSL
ncbi:Fructose-2,6-bisphosphatase [Mortierella polycephala]|uniref:fructose-2,6-bisphosphate 2-phosphatase n=1 Tax=Mortierella polycephala TaxID=41804 RepID=A0A9P6PPH2_9FUNG|nr:Fructose-2,6-bisphosphatase [Mortierella polycephala]